MLAPTLYDSVLLAGERAALASVLETFVPPESDHASALEFIEHKLTMIPARRVRQLRQLLRLLSGRLLTATLAGKPVPFWRLDSAARERVLLAMANSEVEILRTSFQALKRLSLFMAYAAVDARGRNPLWGQVGYPGPRQDAFSSSSALPILRDVPAELHADAVVVGSGAGGGVAAGVLAQAGKHVIVLEAGDYYDGERFTQREAEMMHALYLEAGSASSDDLAVILLAGACLGGGTTVNCSSALQLPGEIAHEWSAASGGIDFDTGLRSHVSAVERRLDVRTAALNRNNAALMAGCTQLGWDTHEILRNASGCDDGCGYCNFGCRYGNRRSTVQTYLQDAAAGGASIIPRARVQSVIMRGDRATGVEAQLADARLGAAATRRIRVHAPLVVLAAGALRTPGILTRSAINNPHVGRHLFVHPSVALMTVFDEKIETWSGPMQTVYSDRWARLDGHYGARLEVVPVHPGSAAASLPWNGQQQHAALMRQLPYAAALSAFTRDRDEGWIFTKAHDRVHYRLSSYDARHMLQALDALVDVAFAAGARRVSTLHTKPLTLERSSASAQNRAHFSDAIFAAGAEPNRLGVFSAHQMGTCRMHRDPRHGVVNEFGLLHGKCGIVIADSSVFPTACGVNPMLTIMALAHRSATFHAQQQS